MGQKAHPHPLAFSTASGRGGQMHLEHWGELRTDSSSLRLMMVALMQGRQTLILSRISFCYHSSRFCN